MKLKGNKRYGRKKSSISALLYIKTSAYICYVSITCIVRVIEL